jgi:hypothetical protein
MTTYDDFAQQAPELAAAVRARFEAGPTAKHHVLATLRADGSPRVSGTEVGFRNGELFLGSMPGARKALDLQRDPRFALHAHTGDGTMAGGDAKVAGRAVEATDDATLAAFRSTEQPAGPYHLFLLDLDEVVLTTVADDQLVVQLWRPGQPVRTTRRT